MADATALTVTSLNANGTTASPAQNVLTAATAATTLSGFVGGKTDRVVIEVENLTTVASNTFTFTVLSGDNPPAFRSGVGNLSKSAIASGSKTLFGPLESARFIQDDGSISVTVTPSSGVTLNMGIRTYKLPKV